MSAATASIADVPRTDSTSEDDHRDRSKSGRTQAQCTLRPLPALGTQRIIQGNGTTVGTVISLQCPARHKLVGLEMTCVMDSNSTHWVGNTYCKPVSPFEDYGFRVAVLASIVSLGVIFFMSVAFITCCLLDCIKEDKRKKHGRDSEMWQWEEPAQHRGDGRSHHSQEGWNNNNNNTSTTREKAASLWPAGPPAACDTARPCGCHQQYALGPAAACGRSPPLSTLPGYDCERPLLPRSPGPARISGGPPQCRRAANPGLVRASAAVSGVARHYGGRRGGPSGVDPPAAADEAGARDAKEAKEFSIRIISV
ncbi:susd3 [Pungitius sinensis]